MNQKEKRTVSGSCQWPSFNQHHPTDDGKENRPIAIYQIRRIKKETPSTSHKPPTTNYSYGQQRPNDLNPSNPPPPPFFFFSLCTRFKLGRDECWNLCFNSTGVPLRDPLMRLTCIHSPSSCYCASLLPGTCRWKEKDENLCGSKKKSTKSSVFFCFFVCFFFCIGTLLKRRRIRIETGFGWSV